MSHHISRCSVEAFALTLPFSLGHEITVVALRYYSYKYCKLHIWGYVFYCLSTNLIGIYLKENPLLSVLFMALFSGLLFSGCFFLYPFFKEWWGDSSSHKVQFSNFGTCELHRVRSYRDNYKIAYWTSVKGGCSFFSRPTRLEQNCLVNIA